MISNLFGQWMHGGPARTCSQVSSKNISKYSVHLLLKIEVTPMFLQNDIIHTGKKKRRGLKARECYTCKPMGLDKPPTPKACWDSGLATHTTRALPSLKGERIEVLVCEV